MSCELVRRHMGVYVDGELDPASQVEFDRHMTACPACAEHLAFERSFREQLRESLRAQPALGPEQRAALERRVSSALAAEPDRAGGARAFPLQLRHALPMAAAAAAALAIGGYAGLPSPAVTAPAATQGAASAMSVFQDLARIHRDELPADVTADGPEGVSDFFRTRVQFPVRPAEFERNDVRLVGGRVSNVRERRAAALYYDVGGHRVTVVVSDQPAQELERGALKARFGGQELFYQRVNGYTVPVRRHAGLTYAFTGDLEQRQMLQLAATSRIRY